MNFKLILVMTFCCPLLVQSVEKSPCSKSDLDQITFSVNTCITQRAEQRNFSTTSNPICDELDEILTCGDLYKRCFNEKELRNYMDNVLELIIHYMEIIQKRGSEIQSCSVVQEYLQSGRRGIFEPTEKCTGERVSQVADKNKKCFEEGNNHMEKILGGGRFRGEPLFKALCKILDQIIHQCGILLKECFSEEEVQDIKSSQRELIQKLLLELTAQIGNPIDINKCSVRPVNLGSNFASAPSTGLKLSSQLGSQTFIILFLINKFLGFF